MNKGLRALLVAIFVLGAARSTSAQPVQLPELNWIPRSDWINVQEHGVTGDGLTDDTAALQRVLDQVENGSTFFFPAGTYRITDTLTMTGPGLGVSWIGQGRTTRLLWDGAQDGYLFKEDGFAQNARYEGFVFDGQGKAAVGFWHFNTTRFETEVLHRNMAFLGFRKAGIYIEPTNNNGGDKYATAETVFQNCLFSECKTGVWSSSFNDYNHTYDGCEFVRCGTGLYYTKGNFYVRNTHFEESREADMVNLAEHGCSVRRTTSWGSKAFIRHGSSVGPLVIEDCHVGAWTDSQGSEGAITLKGGPVLMFDCSFSEAPDHHAPVKVNSQGQQITISECTTETGGPVCGRDMGDSKYDIAAAQKYLTHIHTVPAGQRNGNLTSPKTQFLKETWPTPGKVFDACRDFGAAGDGRTDDTAAAQAAIQAAADYGRGAIAYFPKGQYVLTSTLNISGSDYTVGGCGPLTRLLWRGQAGGTTLAVHNPQRVTLENIMVGHHDSGTSSNAVDILHTATQASSMTYEAVYVYGMYQKHPRSKGFLFTDLPKKSLIVLNRVNGNLRFENCGQALIYAPVSYEGSLVIEGDEPERNGFMGFQTRLTTIAQGGLYLRDGHSLVASDFYIEQCDSGYHVEGSPEGPCGRITIQSPKLHLSEKLSAPPAIVQIDNYTGEIILGPVQGSCWPIPFCVEQTGVPPSSLVVLNSKFYETFPDWRLASSNCLYQLGNVGPGPYDRIQKKLPDLYQQFPHHETSNRITDEGLAAISRGLDDLRQLGAVDLAINYPKPPVDSKPTRLLFLKGNVEIGFGQPLPLDAHYAEKLKAEGFDLTEARDFQPLTLDYLQQFHAIIWINPSPYEAGSRYFGPDSWQGGQHMNTVRKNAELLRQYAEAGGGLLINPAVEEIGMPVVASHKKLLAPYGIDTECAQVRDQVNSIEFDRIAKRYPIYAGWTTRIAAHQATKGVGRIYYPAYTMRWDDNITTLPLYLQSTNWTALVTAMPEATASWYRGTPYEEGHWKDAEGRPDPVIAAARPYGLGRVAVVSLCHFHLFYFPYSEATRHQECYFGPQQGCFMETGFEDQSSDLALLMSNLYRWLAEPAESAGNVHDRHIEAAPIPTWDVANISEVWADRDPGVTGPIRPIKILVGAHSACSDGRGTPAEWAAAARAAGYDAIAFTETYEAMTDEDFTAFVQACEDASDDDVALLPGLDIADAYGNRFLVLGKDTPVRPHLLTRTETDTPGRTLIWTGHLLLGMGEVLPVAARPQQLNTTREHGRLPTDLYSHCPGVAVATYRDGQQVDDGLFAYEWQLFNASAPIPVAVHEVFAPEELATAAATGLQTYVNSDTPARALFYFRQGHMSVGGNPMRHYVSSGPLFDTARIDNWQATNWTIQAKAHGPAPITQVLAHDQRGVYRNISCHSNRVEVSWHGDLGAQHWFMTELRDEQGGRAYLSPIRTLPERAFMRCVDRQNWFAGLSWKFITYTGRTRSLPQTGATLELPGKLLPTEMVPRLQMSYIGPGHVITDYLVDSRLLPETGIPGQDSFPMFNTRTNEFFNGRIRHRYYPQPGGKGFTPEWVRVEAEMTLQQNLSATPPVFPVLAKLRDIKPGSPYTYSDANGLTATGHIEKGVALKLQPGDCVGSLMALSPLVVSDRGLVGCLSIPAPLTVDAESRYSIEYLLVHTNEHADVRRALGFDGPHPCKLELSQGKLTSLQEAATAAADHYGLAGTLSMESNSWWSAKRLLPLQVTGINPNWPVGLWRQDDDSIQAYKVFEGEALGAIDPTGPTAFYFGNLLLADDPRIKLSFAGNWTAENAAIEINNPTDKTITTTIRTPKAISRKAVNKRIKLQPGEQVLLSIP